MNRRWLWLVVAIAGGTAAILGSGLGVLAIVLGLTSGAAQASGTTLPAAALIALALGLGIPVAYQGWAGWRERDCRPFEPRSVWWMGVLLVLSIGPGWVVTALPVAPDLLLPLLHAVAMTLPPLILLSLTGRALRGKGGSWREVITSMGGGGLLATTLSLLVEGALVMLLVALVSLALWAMPGGAERVRELFESFQDPTSLEDSAVLVRWLLNPVVLLFAVGVMGVAVPVIEEAFKTLAGGVAGAWVRPHAARAFLWGVASGAGFAIAENLINGAMGGQEAWVAGAVARVGATVMHCFTGGLVGWGWGELWTRRRPLRMLGSVVAAVVLHGIWNTLAIGTMVLGAVAVAHQTEPIWQGLAWSGVAILVGMLGVIAMACAVALPLIARRLAKADGSGAAGGGESSLEAAGDQVPLVDAEVAA